MHITEGMTSNLTTIFEEFLKKWRYADNDDYVFPKEDWSFSKCPGQSDLDSEKYLEVAEVFTMVLLGRVLRQPQVAISWIEKSDLPEDKRQVPAFMESDVGTTGSDLAKISSDGAFSSPVIRNASEKAKLKFPSKWIVVHAASSHIICNTLGRICKVRLNRMEVT